MSGHYFQAEPAVPSAPREIVWSLGAREFRVTTDTGVFSGEQLDPGTAVLLERGPSPSGAVLLDLGCGWGPVAMALADRLPEATVWAVDVNSRALRLARANADRAGFGPRVLTALPDEVPAEIVFDQIWSNPPVRIGKQDLHELLLRWLPRLGPGGEGWLVVGRHLGADSLASWLTGEGYTVTRTAGARGYRVLRVSGDQGQP